MNPFLIISFKPYEEFRCGRGCNCFHGSSSEDLRVAVFDDPEKAAKYIASINFYNSKNPNSDANFTHRLIPAESLASLASINDYETQWDSISQIPEFDETAGILDRAAELADDLLVQDQAKKKAELEEAARKKEEEKRQAIIDAAVQRELADREEYERLKQKYEDKGDLV